LQGLVITYAAITEYVPIAPRTGRAVESSRAGRSRDARTGDKKAAVVQRYRRLVNRSRCYSEYEHSS
jgi:hypothetical protein